MIKISLLKEELIAAGLDVYGLGLDENDALFVRFLENGIKRPPTAAEQQTIDAVVAAHDPDGLTKVEQLRETIKGLAQSAVGVTLNNLTNNQKDALLAILLWQAGAVADDLTVNPLKDWAK